MRSVHVLEDLHQSWEWTIVTSWWSLQTGFIAHNLFSCVLCRRQYALLVLVLITQSQWSTLFSYRISRRPPLVLALFKIGNCSWRFVSEQATPIWKGGGSPFHWIEGAASIWTSSALNEFFVSTATAIPFLKAAMWMSFDILHAKAEVDRERRRGGGV